MNELVKLWNDVTFKEIVMKFRFNFSFFLTASFQPSTSSQLYLCLCGVGAIVQLQEELAGPSAQQRCVSPKMREEFVRTGHLDPEKHMANGSGDDITGYT